MDVVLWHELVEIARRQRVSFSYHEIRHVVVAAIVSALKDDFILQATVEPNETPRKVALIEAFSERLASAIVAIVEEP